MHKRTLWLAATLVLSAVSIASAQEGKVAKIGWLSPGLQKHQFH
jgi:hypothetical protein